MKRSCLTLLVFVVLLFNNSASFGQTEMLASGPPLVCPVGIAISPDGTTLFISDCLPDDAIFRLPATGGTPTAIASGDSFGSIRGITISPDGSALFVTDIGASGAGPGVIWSLPATGGTRTVLASGGPLVNPHGIATSPDGSTLFIADNWFYHAGIYSLPATGGEPILLAAVPSFTSYGRALDICVSPDGNTLFVAGGFCIYSLPSTGGALSVIPCTTSLSYATSIALSCDGQTLFILDSAGLMNIGPTLIYRLPISGGTPTLVLSGPPLAAGGFMRLSHDGTKLYVTDFGEPARVFVLSVAEPPVANAGDNIQIPSADQAHTVIQGTVTDPDGDILEYRWLDGEQVLLDWSAAGSNGEAYLVLAVLPYFSIGNHTLILEAREVKSCGLSDSDEMVLTIENSPPVVQAAPKHQVVEVGVDPIVVVGDAGDFDGDTLSYKWLDDNNNVLASGTVATTPGGEPVAIPDLNVPAGDARFPVGEHTVRLQVSDGINEPVTDSVSVEVTDTTAPSLSPVPSVTILWPPNHKLIPVTIWANAFDNGGGDIVLSVKVQSSEPADAIGDGNTDVDYYIDSVNNETGVIELRLRSERAGKGDGRVYTITITATDANQNQSNAAVQILAPHDKSKK
jgi:DNA-binding beta-propeller fold protein YncE